ncbi:hypothetical protein ACFY8B_35365, partial [Streptomyces sp. NPDC012751]|uniref:hypothetical protein n=1 Tax=Streptomyces sp. NPDC012751 TaxID=3364846 RepID=UPI003697FEC7
MGNLLKFLTGMEWPDLDETAMQRRVVLPHVELQRDLRELQGLIAQVSHSVEGAVEGAWSEAYARAMATFGTGAGADQIKALTDT